MITFEPPKKGNIPAYSSPEKWEELTAGQFFRLMDWETASGSEIWKLEIITGVPSDVWLSAPTEEVEGHLALLLWTLTGMPDWSALPLPKKVTVNGVKYDYPKTLKSEPYAVTMALNNEVNARLPKSEDDDTTDLIKLIPLVFSLVMQHRVNGGTFDEAKAANFVSEVNNLAATEVLPVGFTFLRTTASTLYSGRRALRTLLTVTN